MIKEKTLLEKIEKGLSEKKIDALTISIFRGSNIKVINKTLYINIANDFLPILKSLENELDFVYKKIAGDDANIKFGNFDNLKENNNLKNSEKALTINTMGLVPNSSFENYYKTQSNKEVYEIAQKIIEKFGLISPIFVYGESGVGKSHAVQAMGNNFILRGKSTIYMSSFDFSSKSIKALKSGGHKSNEFIESFDKYDAFILDDIQNLSGKNKVLKVLFDVVERFIVASKQIILTADKTPEALSGFEDRLITRFQGGITTKINPLNQKEVCGFVKWSDSNFIWEKSGYEFMGRNFYGNTRRLTGALRRIDFIASAFVGVENKITSEILEKVFKDIDIKDVKLTNKQIASSVSKYTKISEKDIFGKIRLKAVVQARHILMYLLYKHMNTSYNKIGNYLKGKDHTTVKHGVEKIKKEIKNDESLRLAIKEIEKLLRKI
ncbi:MAG: ATP-binding protein [Mollicutes bacterium PWAP]|nr:ATP-binding protein [Mollicutes bacterium PWAP]